MRSWVGWVALMMNWRRGNEVSSGSGEVESVSRENGVLGVELTFLVTFWPFFCAPAADFFCCEFLSLLLYARLPVKASAGSKASQVHTVVATILAMCVD